MAAEVTKEPMDVGMLNDADLAPEFYRMHVISMQQQKVIRRLKEEVATLTAANAALQQTQGASSQ